MIGIPAVMLSASTVHTTGINWESVITLVCVIVGALGVILGLFAKWIGDRITSSINQFRIDVVSSLDTRLTRVEGKIDGISKQRR